MSKEHIFSILSKSIALIPSHQPIQKIQNSDPIIEFDVNIYIVIQTEGLDCFFPMAHRLQFVENQIGFSAIRHFGADIVIESEIISQRPVTQGFQIHMDNVRFRNPLFQEIPMVQLQQG